MRPLVEPVVFRELAILSRQALRSPMPRRGSSISSSIAPRTIGRIVYPERRLNPAHVHLYRKSRAARLARNWRCGARALRLRTAAAEYMENDCCDIEEPECNEP